MINKILFTCLVSFTAIFSLAQDYSSYEKKLLVVKGDTMPYRLLLPKNYDPGKKYPVIFFLHGAGERGNDNSAQLMHGGTLFLVDSIREKYQAFVVFPQCSATDTWANATRKQEADGKIERVFQVGGEPTKDMVLVLRLIKSIVRDYPVNKKQVYVGGLSLGGMGTFEIVRRNPKLFAAAFPICGGANVAIAPKLKYASWWVFHGADDKTVSPKFSIDMVAAMKKEGVKVRFTIYPNTDHNSWDKVFIEPDLIKWLFSNVKGKPVM